jgi:hypothetical protein
MCEGDITVPSSLPVFPLRLPAELRARLEAVAAGSLNAEIVRRLEASLAGVAAPVAAPVVRLLIPPTSTPVPAPAPPRVRLPLLALSTPGHCARAAQHRPGAFCKTCGGSG